MSIKDYFRAIQNTGASPGEIINSAALSGSSVTSMYPSYSSTEARTSSVFKSTMDISIAKIENGFLLVSRGKTYYAQDAAGVSEQLTALIVAERMESK